MVARDNTGDFLEAAEDMCIAMRRYLKGNRNAKKKASAATPETD